MRYSSALLFAAGAGKVLADEACSPLHFIYARATTEKPGGITGATSPAEFEKAAARDPNKGYGAAGHSIFTNLTALIPAATGWPVHYPASWGGASSEDPGVADILRQLSTKAKACPQQKYVLGGHSQGGVVTVRAIPKIEKDILPRVIAVTMVGSPNCPAEVAGRCKSFCNQGDGICSGGAGSAKGSAPKPPKSSAGPTKEFPQPVPKGGTGDMPTMDMSNDKPAAKGTGDMAGMGMRMRKRQVDPVGTTAANSMCAGPEVPEKGHKAVGSEGAHMLYNKDGYYTRAAACYILKQYKASGGA